MNLYTNLKGLFGPGKVLEVKDGDRGSNDLKDYLPVIFNIKEKYVTIPEDRIYDIVIDTILFYNSYSKKTTKTTNILTFFKMSMNQGAINYMSIKRNHMNDTAVSIDYLMEEGVQLEG